MKTPSDPFDDVADPRRQGFGDRSLVVALSGYEGPLDALLTLARDHKIDLANMSMRDLVDQYLVFLNEHAKANIELSADYLVMAAWLAYLKSRLLIPPTMENEADQEAAEVAGALADQVRRLRAMEEAASNWLASPHLGREHSVRGMEETVRGQMRPAWVEGYFDYLLTCVPTTPAKRPMMLQIGPTDLYSVEEAILRVERFLETQVEWAPLQECLPQGLRDIKARSALASHLVATLELCRQEKADVRQDDGQFAPIRLRRRAKQS